MKKKLLSVLLAAAMALTAFSVPVLAADVDTNLYLYDIQKDSGSPVAAGNNYGWGNATNAWGTPDMNKTGTGNGIYWFYATKSDSNRTNPASRYIDLTKQNAELFTDLQNEVIKLDLDFVAEMKTNTNPGTFDIVFSGTGGNIADFTITGQKSSKTGTAAFSNVEGKSYSYTLNNNDSNTYGMERGVLSVVFDMQNQKYSATYTKTQSYTGSSVSEVEKPIPVVLAENEDFLNEVTDITTLTSTMKNYAGNDYMCIGKLDMSILSDQSVANNAITLLSLPESTTTNLTLPTSLAGAEIAWESNQTDVISDTGAVTRPTDEDATVELKATATRGTAQAQETFTVKVPADLAPMSGNTADSDAPEGQLMMDEMPYPSAFRMPTEGDYSFATVLPDSTSNTIAFVDDAQSAVVSENGAISADGTGVTFIKKGSASPYFAKWLATEDIATDTVLEFAYDVIGDPEIQIQFERKQDWHPIFNIYDKRNDGTFSGNGGMKVGSVSGDQTKVTMYIHFGADQNSSSVTLYVNDEYFDTATFRNDSYAGMTLAKMRFTLSDGATAGEGFKLKYIHMYDAAKYGANAVAVDKAALEAAMPDKTVSVTNGQTVDLFKTASVTGNTITWASSDNTAINPQTGLVTAAYEDKTVTMTAAIENASGAKDTVEYTYHVAKTVPQIVEGAAAQKITVNEEGLDGYAVGFYGEAATSETYDREFGFRLSAPSKDDWDIKVTVPAVIEGGASVKYGLILTADTDTLEDVTAKTIYKDIPNAE